MSLTSCKIQTGGCVLRSPCPWGFEIVQILSKGRKGAGGEVKGGKRKEGKYEFIS
jgi:hypothetical protein